MQFSELGLAEPLARAVSDAGYERPTPIQAEIVPAMIAGRDVVGIAQTGTGKTAAYVLPLLHRLSGMKGRAKPNTCRALVVVPTRELAAQVNESIRTYGRHMHLKTAIVIGGVKPGPQRKQLAGGCDVVIATPGRLEDHMRDQAVRLSAVKVVVLDEADQMLDLGFAPAIRRIMGELPDHHAGGRQTALLSATMPAPIRQIARDYLSDPKEVTVERQGKPIDKIAQRVIHVPRAAKRAMLEDILKAPDVEHAIVFARTKRGADRVSKGLNAAGIDAVVIHGDRSQGQRDRALADFKSRKARVMVATDIAARGIDIDGVSHVVNFELPNVPEAYVHRIGRTARAGTSGVAITLVDIEERKLLRDIEKLIKMTIPAEGETDSADFVREDRKPGTRPPPRPRGPNGKKLPRKKKKEKPANARSKPSAPRGGGDKARSKDGGAPRPAPSRAGPRRNTRRPARSRAAE